MENYWQSAFWNLLVLNFKIEPLRGGLLSIYGRGLAPSAAADNNLNSKPVPTGSGRSISSVNYNKRTNKLGSLWERQILSYDWATGISWRNHLPKVDRCRMLIFRRGGEEEERLTWICLRWQGRRGRNIPADSKDWKDHAYIRWKVTYTFLYIFIYTATCTAPPPWDSGLCIPFLPFCWVIFRSIVFVIKNLWYDWVLAIFFISKQK